MQPQDKFIFHWVAVFKGDLVQRRLLGWLCSCNCSLKSFFGGVQSIIPPTHLHGTPGRGGAR